MNNLIDFKRNRNFDQVIEDSFTFIKFHSVSFIKIFWKLNSVYIIIFMILLALFSFYGLNSFPSINVQNNKLQELDMSSTEIIVSIIFAIYSIYFTYLFYATFFGYVQSYIQNLGNIDENFIVKIIKDKFWGYIGLMILIILMFLVGFLLFIIPGVWLIVPASLMIPAYFLDSESITDAIRKSFKFTKNNWWFGFGILFISFIITMILSYLLNLPLMIYTAVKLIFLAKESGNEALSQINTDPVLSFFNFISGIIKFLLTIISLSIMTFLYYTLKERHTSEGALEKLEELSTVNEK